MAKWLNGWIIAEHTVTEMNYHRSIILMAAVDD